MKILVSTIKLDHPAIDASFQSDEGMDTLVNSMRKEGLINPISVRQHPSEPGAWQLTAGLRRFRAAQRLDWTYITAELRDEPPGMMENVATGGNSVRSRL